MCVKPELGESAKWSRRDVRCWSRKVKHSANRKEPYNGFILKQRKALSSTVSADFYFSTPTVETKM